MRQQDGALQQHCLQRASIKIVSHELLFVLLPSSLLNPAPYICAYAASSLVIRAKPDYITLRPRRISSENPYTSQVRILQGSSPQRMHLQLIFHPFRSDTTTPGINIIYHFGGPNDRPIYPDATRALFTKVVEDAAAYEEQDGSAAPIGRFRKYWGADLLHVVFLELNPGPNMAWGLWLKAAQKMEQRMLTTRPTTDLQFSALLDGLGSVGKGSVYSQVA